MRKFYVIANFLKDKDYALSKTICSYLQDRGCECSYQIAREGDPYNSADSRLVPEGTECVIVLGGDGTLIQAARDLSGIHMPVFGVNIGTLGYLTDIDSDQLFQALDSILEGNYLIDDRMILKGDVIRNGEVIYSNNSLNDIVLNRVGPLRVIQFDIYVNQEFLISYSADGLVVATPTGSTAYNMSAGGPIIQPKSKMIIMTPICAHSLSKSSVIFDGEDQLEIVMTQTRDGVEERAVTFDGAQYCSLVSGDRIVIRKTEGTARFLHTGKQNFLQILRNKLS